MITNKSDLKKIIAENLPKYPLISKYYLKTILHLIDSTGSLHLLLEQPLIRYAALNDVVFARVEKYIEEHLFVNIEVPLKRLETNFDEYDAVIAELRVAKLLQEEGMTDIYFIKEEGNPDISYKEGSVVRYAEVKSLKELDPEVPILDNKLAAKSVFDTRFRKWFYIQLSHNLLIGSLDIYVKKLRAATEKLIQALDGYIEHGKVEDALFDIDDFKFTVSFDDKKDGYHFMYSGDVMTFGSNKDIFLSMSSVYSRFINTSANGLRQLLKRRGRNPLEVKRDRLYLFLNTERYANFVPEELKKIFSHLSKLIGIDDLVTLKIEL